MVESSGSTFQERLKEKEAEKRLRELKEEEKAANDRKYAERGLMGGLALRGLGGVKAASGAVAGQAVKQGVWILIFPFVLAILDFVLGKNGIPLDFLWTDPNLLIEAVTRIVVDGPYWVFLAIYIILRKPHSKEEFLFPAVLFLVGFLTVTFGGWNNWIFYHGVFAAFTFVFLLKGFDSSRPISQEHWIFLLIFVIDIFGLATLKELNAGIIGGAIPAIFLNRIVFPIWFFYYLALTRESTFKTGITIFIVLFYAGYVGFNYVGAANLEVQSLDVEKAQAGGALKQAYENWRDAVTSWLSGQIQYAITGKVEENQYEPLGVYLENVQSADPKYYADESAVVWGTVKARTLDDPIKIRVGCYVQRDIDKMHADDTDPENEFEVFALEEQEFACTFNGCDLEIDPKCEHTTLKKGSNTIITFVDFNFETLAYLKAYFINMERQRAMVREGLDVFEEFDIKDKNPVSVYTNGPVEIGMKTTMPLTGVSESYTIYPTLSFSLQNRIGWEGKITGLRELVLFFPEGIEVKDPAKDCNKEFKIYTKDNCTKSCGANEKCEKTCESLFEGNYNAYSLNTDDLRVRDELKDFEKFKLFRCRFKPDVSVLGGAPISTKYFRAKAKYDYTLEKPVTVKVVEIPKLGENDLSVAPPTNLKASYSKDDGGVKLEWTLSADDNKNADDVVGYNVYRKEENGEYGEPIAKLPDFRNKYIDKFTPEEGVKYFYQVEAVDKRGNKASKEVSFSI